METIRLARYRYQVQDWVSPLGVNWVVDGNGRVVLRSIAT